MTDVSDEAQRAGRQAERSDALDTAVRIGMVAYGVVHLMLGWLAVQLALGGRNENASAKGALAELARQPFGTALVWAIAVGMFLLVAWRVLEASVGHRDERDDTARLRKRVTSAVKAVIYGALGVSAVKVAVGARSSGRGSKGMTATVLGWPGGQVLVVAAGLAVIGYAGAVAWRGWSEKFAEHLDTEGRLGTSGAAYLVLGKLGYVAKGIALALVGGLVVFAGIDQNSNQAGGLDQALQKVLGVPFGQVLLIAIGIGLACYGLFCFARARHLSR